MRILHVVTAYPPAFAYGGPPRSVSNLAQAQVDAGHDVTVFTTDANDATSRVTEYQNPEWVEGIEVYRFRNLSTRLAWRNIPLAPGLLPALTRVNEYDVVHTHEYRTAHTAFAHLGTRISDTPHVLQPRGSASLSGPSLAKRVYDSYGQHIVESADALLVSSSEEKQHLREIGESVSERDFHRIPNGVDFRPYETLPPRGRFRNELNIDAENPLVLYVGRLHNRKGLVGLVEAVDNLRDKYPDIHLAIVGPDEGAHEDILERAADLDFKDAVSLPGPKYDENLVAAYRDADVFVLPSVDTAESFGNVVVEALAAGTPAVVTDVCGVSEWVDPQFAEVVEPNTADIARGIDLQFRDRSAVDSKSMRNYVRENFSWKSIAENTLTIYEAVA